MHPNFRPAWTLTAVAGLALLALVVASGCINGESITTSAHDGPGAADDPVGGAGAARGLDNSAGGGTASIPSAGDVLIAGGSSPSNKTLATSEFFDPSASQFFATGSMADSRAGAAAAPISQSKVLVDGGFSGGAAIKQFSLNLDGKVLSSAEIFDTTTGAFSSAAPMGTPRMAFTATPLGNGRVLVAGGFDSGNNVLDSAEVYNPGARKFVAVNNTMSDRRVFHTATLLPSGKVLVAGGATNLSGDTTNSADLYDPASNSFTPTYPMDHQRAAHSATLLTSGPAAGKVLIAGGGGGSSVFFKDSSAEIYDPAAQQFMLLASFMNEPRALHTATMLDDGSVLLAGGFNGSVAISGGVLSGASGSISNSAETFDPNSLEFSCVGGFNDQNLRCNQSMSAARAGHTATLLTNGPSPHRVLIAGGIGAADPNAHGIALSSAEIYNPAGGGSFTPAGPMSAARAFQTATLLR
jgi:Galactose oxidase, central domain/Kelch motif